MMGLDMCLTGEKYFTIFGRLRKTEDGFEVTQHSLELGYWRKHPDLHGFIVNEFADGKDNCQPIHLGPEDILKIIDAIN